MFAKTFLFLTPHYNFHKLNKPGWMAVSAEKYRPDIDGLRAIAVGSVVIQHAFPGLIPGGFIGVDIFFVISGFLISSILLEQLDDNRFSIIGFYNKRIRRIFPTLVFVLLSCMAAGWWLLLNQEYKQLGKHVFGGASFLSNYLLWQESGYFDPRSEQKPLLHLWSLAVEEQFYLFWPLLLAFFRRRMGFLWITALVFIASFIFNIYILKTSPITAFFLPFSRFWELMAGGILAYLSLRHREWLAAHGNLRSTAGLGLLLLGFSITSKDSRFPGWWALLPTAGAFLLISAGPNAWVNRHLLSLRGMVGLGLISYPLYLWHWPLLAFENILDLSPSTGTKAWLVAASVLLAWMTYRWIEQPLRFSRWTMMPAALLGSLGVLGLAGLGAYSTSGYSNIGSRNNDKSAFEQYFDNNRPDWKYFHHENLYARYNHKCNFYNTKASIAGQIMPPPVSALDQACYTRDTAKTRTLMIWGDSHAQHFYPGLSASLPTNWQILQVASSGCKPNFTVTQDSSVDHCIRSNWFALETIRRVHPDIVLVGQVDGHETTAMAAMEKVLKNLGARAVVFVGPAVQWHGSLPDVMARHLWRDKERRTWLGVKQDVIQIDKQLAASFSNKPTSRYVSLVHYFCNAEGCLTYVGNELIPGLTSYDYGHLSPAASEAFARDALVPVLEDVEKYVTGSVVASAGTP